MLLQKNTDLTETIMSGSQQVSVEGMPNNYDDSYTRFIPNLDVALAMAQ